MSNAVATNDSGPSTLESATPQRGDASNDPKVSAPTKRLHTRANLGWVAGFLDAEGCIRIDKREGDTTAETTYALEVSIPHASRSALEHFRSLAKIEGTLVAHRLLEGHQWIYLLSYRDAQAAQLLTLVEPYLVATYRRAQVGFDFHHHHQQWKQKTRGGSDARAVAQWHAQCEVVRVQLQSLKRVA